MIDLQVMQNWLGCECGSGQDCADSSNMIKREMQMVTRGVRETARKCKCSPSMICRIFNGKRKPGPELARRMRKLGLEF